MAVNLQKNVLWNVVEVGGNSLGLFFLYKLILASLSVSALGVWSLVLATTSLARVADVGAAGGLGRYVALNSARGREGLRSLLYVESALFLNAAIYIGLGIALYWPAWYALGLTTHGDATVEARNLLPFAMASFTLMNVANVITAALTGLHRSYQKSVVVICTQALQVGIAALMVKSLGLRAVALGQIAQYSVLTIVGWFLIVRAVSGRTMFAVPHRIAAEPLRDLIGFGLRLQILNLVSFPFEPLVKFTFSAVGGLSALGVYELASRGILQVRQLVVAPSQNLTPLFAAEFDQNPTGLEPLYVKAAASLIAVGAAAMAVMTIGSPLLSLIWLGKIDYLFVVFSALLGLGWFVNISSCAGYFLGLGSGILRWNILGGAVATALAGVLGAMLGAWLKGTGVALGAMVGMAAGSLVTWILNCRELRMRVWPDRHAWHVLMQTVVTVPLIVSRRLGFGA